MARQITPKSVLKRLPYNKLPVAPRSRIALFAASVILANVCVARAESLASKNREGNHLFAQGKYEDAEKAYIEAEAKSPGRPEVLYNLGNSLIKQEKYQEGIQILHQSIGKGETEIKEHSWYNAGNALYSMGNFRDSVEAYIQALRLDPSDKDAKHNLELALQRLKQQEQKESKASENRKNSEDSAPEQSAGDRKGVPERNKQVQNSSGKDGEQNGRENSQSRNIMEGAESLSKEQALQILDAIQNQEVGEYRKLLDHRAGQTPSGKDW